MFDKKDASFMRALCQGEIAEDLILPFPRVSPAERETLEGAIASLRSLLEPRAGDFSKWDRDGEMPGAFVDELKRFGLFGLIVPEQFGGLGFGSTAYSRALQEVARYDASVAVTIGAHSSIGMRGLLLFGTDAQKERFLPALATGEKVAAFCLTESQAGSDAAAVKTTATKSEDGWVLNGNKIWITNGGIANFFTVFAKTEKSEERRNMTAFLITDDMPGVTIGPHEDKMGLRANPTTAVYFDEVRVPADHVLGEVGNGFKVAMKILNAGRTGLGGGCVGAMKHLIELSTQQAKQRVQFQKPIAEYGLIKQKVGHMVVECYASESVVAMVAGLVDQGYEDYAVEAAISKVFATEALWRTADEALQIAGGNGFMREYPYEHILRDCRVNRIFEGTNDILRLFIALTAMNDVGTQLKELSKTLKGVFNDPIKGFGLLSDYALKRATLATGLSRGSNRFTKLATGLEEPATVFEDGTRHLASAVDRILRKHGRDIIEKQFATKRLADIMIDLFVLACVLSRVSASVQTKGPDAASHEIEILRVFAGQVRGRVARNFAKIDENDDELIKSLADQAFETERFIWDNL